MTQVFVLEKIFSKIGFSKKFSRMVHILENGDLEWYKFSKIEISKHSNSRIVHILEKISVIFPIFCSMFRAILGVVTALVGT